MVSNIDPTKPVTGVDQPVKTIRNNFAAAKVEIEEIQEAAGLNTGTGVITNGLLNVPQFANIGALPLASNSESSMVYMLDIKRMAYSDGTNWLRIDTHAIIL